MKIHEIYLSLQGEGSEVGRPCVFVRLQGCNLSCSWCDTTYARSRSLRVRDLKVKHVLQEIDALSDGGACKLVEITGGEPMLQAEEVMMLGKHLRDAHYEILIETNGSIDLSAYQCQWIRYVVDYKLPSSGMESKMCLKNLKVIKKKDELKFVVQDYKDFKRALGIIREHRPRSQILFSPVWGKLSPAELADWILTERIDCRLSLQQHKIIWGENTIGK